MIKDAFFIQLNCKGVLTLRQNTFSSIFSSFSVESDENPLWKIVSVKCDENGKTENASGAGNGTRMNHKASLITILCVWSIRINRRADYEQNPKAQYEVNHEPSSVLYTTDSSKSL